MNICFYNPKDEYKLTNAFDLLIPTHPKQGEILKTVDGVSIAVGYVSNFNGITLSKDYINPEAVEALGFGVWNLDEKTKYDKDPIRDIFDLI